MSEQRTPRTGTEDSPGTAPSTEAGSAGIRVTRPGWPELGIATLAALVFYAVGSLVVFTLPGGVVVSGLAQFALSGLAPLCAFAVAVLLRIRDVRAFGFRRVHPKWLLLAVLIAAGCVALTLVTFPLLEPVFPGSDDVQADYRAAGSSSVLAFAGIILLGGILTPIGEEVLFRGVLANVLFRWGTPVAVILSSAVFAVAHGVNGVMVNAFIVGVFASLMLRYTRSIWPAIVIHMVFNSTYLFLEAFPA
ncbi:type II CAAX endopeptidase family protein [Streptosporangium sp. NPDC002544]|uniref:CPBP family intramembrane glutamic endopeptidase n=1 Tax=Streptosporangium sp. NPDC002544 TaxID=3154538 RepID=UPI0033259BF3